MNKRTLKKRNVYNTITKMYRSAGERSLSLDITPIFSARQLRLGVMPRSFPLPDGKSVGQEASLHAGENLTAVQLTISIERGKLYFVFTGYGDAPDDDAFDEDSVPF